MSRMNDNANACRVVKSRAFIMNLLEEIWTSYLTGLAQKSITSAKANVSGTTLLQYRNHDIVKDFFGVIYRFACYVLFDKSELH